MPKKAKSLTFNTYKVLFDKHYNTTNLLDKGITIDVITHKKDRTMSILISSEEEELVIDVDEKALYDMKNIIDSLLKSRGVRSTT